MFYRNSKNKESTWVLGCESSFSERHQKHKNIEKMKRCFYDALIKENIILLVSNRHFHYAINAMLTFPKNAQLSK